MGLRPMRLTNPYHNLLHSAISASKLTNGLGQVHDILSHKNQLQNKTIFNSGLINRLAGVLLTQPQN
jgi:hypothetical protein